MRRITVWNAPLQHATLFYDTLRCLTTWHAVLQYNKLPYTALRLRRAEEYYATSKVCYMLAISKFKI